MKNGTIVIVGCAERKKVLDFAVSNLDHGDLWAKLKHTSAALGTASQKISSCNHVKYDALKRYLTHLYFPVRCMEGYGLEEVISGLANDDVGKKYHFNASSTCDSG